MKGKAYYKKIVQENWWFWRPIMEGKMTYTEMSQLDEDEINEVNAALNYYNELLEKQSKKGGKKK